MNSAPDSSYNLPVTTAVYAGTFDPVTNGHIDIATRAAALFDRVVLAVGARIGKQTLFDVDERVALLRETLAGLDNVTVEPFTGLIVDFAREQDATVLVRGIRNPADYQYENQMAITNGRLSPGLETVMLVADPEHAFLSSTLIKEVLNAGGDVSPFVPEQVAVALRAKSG